MSQFVVIGLLAGLPFLLGLLMRIHTSALFLSIAGGYLLSLFVGDTAGLLSRSIITNSQTTMVAKLVVFFLPVVMTVWIMRKSLGASQLVIHFLPLIGCSMLILILGLPLLTANTQAMVYGSFPGNLLKQMSDAIVGVSVALQLILMWFTARPRPQVHTKHHR